MPLSLPLEKFLGSEAERLASFSYCKLNVTTPVQLYPQPSCRVVLNSDKRENIRSVVFAAARVPTSNEHFSAADSSPFSPSPWASARTCLLLSWGPFVSAARTLAFRNDFHVAFRFFSRSLLFLATSETPVPPRFSSCPFERAVAHWKPRQWFLCFSLQRSIERNDEKEAELRSQNRIVEFSYSCWVSISCR